MTRERFIADCNREIRHLMRNPPDDLYVTELAHSISADPAVLLCLWHTKRLNLSGNRPLDSIRADSAMRRLYTLGDSTIAQLQQTKTEPN